MKKESEKRLNDCRIENGKITEIEWKDNVDPGIAGVKFAKAENICRVVVKLYPAPESDITVEVWFPPEKDWNGNFLGMGNGGSAGGISPISLLNGVSRGYATATTDMGTTLDPDDCIGKPDKWIDFGYRSTHLMTEVGKQLTAVFYGKQPSYSYFMGGSTGGQQALSEAQRYPEDYDGIVCFAPAQDRVRLHSFFIWNWQALHGKESIVYTPEEAKTLKDEIVKRYGAQANNAPGDEFLAYPGNIKVDLDKIREETNFLSDIQYEALKKIYAGPVDPVTGEPIIASFVPGTEAEGLSLVDMGDKDKFAHDFFYLFRWIWGNHFDFMKFDFHKDLQDAIEKLSPILDATSTDLSAFKARGGKLLMISGCSDAIIPYKGAESYYKQVVDRQGGLEQTKEFFRYFLVPGFGHTVGGPGVQELGNLGLEAVPRDKMHDVLCAISAWAEKGEAPECLLATAFENNSLKGAVDHDRPSYVYPNIAKYVSGDPKDPENFRPIKISE